MKWNMNLENTRGAAPGAALEDLVGRHVAFYFADDHARTSWTAFFAWLMPALLSALPHLASTNANASTIVHEYFIHNSSPVTRNSPKHSLMRDSVDLFCYMAAVELKPSQS